MKNKSVDPQKPKSVENRELAAFVVKKFTNARTWREPLKQSWDRYYKLYRTSRDKQNYPWQSNIFVPYVFSTIETIVPRLVSTKPQIDVIPREDGDSDYAKVQGYLIDFQWDKIGMEAMLPDIVRQFLIYGTSILKVYWIKKEEEVETEVPVDSEYPELGNSKVKQKKVTMNQPCVELVDLYDFFWDPNGYDEQTCSWMAHRTYRSYEYLEKMAKEGLYKNVQLLKDVSKKMFLDDNDKSDRNNSAGFNDPKGYASQDDKESNIELIEYWENNRVITIANRSVVIRDEKNPYEHGQKPFVRIVDQSIPKEFAGIGEVGPIETLQYELNDMRNQRMDNATLILNRMWLVANGANVDEDELVSDVGGVIHTDDINGVVALQVPEIPNSSYREETLIKADIQQTTGITDYTKGVSSDALANETATGISLMQEAGNSRLRLKMMNLEYAIKRVGELFVSLNKQFVTEEMAIRVAGQDGYQWLKVKPEEVRDNFDIQVESGSYLQENDAIKRKQSMEMFQLLAGNPLVNQEELLRRVFQSRNEKNIDSLFAQPQSPAINPMTGTPDTTISNVPGGVAGLPGNNDLNASGVMQQSTDATKGL